MKQHPYNRIKLLFATSFILLTLTATAQFNKPLTSPRDRIESSNAKWNIGILGGPNLTTWLHFHSPDVSDWYLKNYNIFDTITNSLGYFGGIGVERMLKNNISVGLNVVYAQHSIQLGFVNEHFPIGWDQSQGQINFGRIVKSFKANYRAIEAYVPVTYYMGLSSKNNIIPYVYAAPRVSYLLPDSTAQMTHITSYYKEDANNTLISSSTNSTPFNRSTYRKFNVGATVGVGSLFRINTNNYYFLIKFDVSANMNGIPTFKKGEIDNNEFNYLRFSTDAHATLTFMLPIKKQLKGACMDWGEYD
jgi:hypothetical protein